MVSDKSKIFLGIKMSLSNKKVYNIIDEI